MDFMEISKKRATVRKFVAAPVKEEDLLKILKAGRWAPTAVNGQPQRILVLDTPENLEKVREFCSFGYDRKYAKRVQECDDKENGRLNFYYGAPLVLLVSYDSESCWIHPQSGQGSGQTDAVIVATRMMLEAACLNLGSAWVSYFDEEKARKLLHLPSSWKPVCLLYIGYPAKDSAPPAKPGPRRKPLSETCFFNGFDDNREVRE